MGKNLSVKEKADSILTIGEFFFQLCEAETCDNTDRAKKLIEYFFSDANTPHWQEEMRAFVAGETPHLDPFGELFVARCRAEELHQRHLEDIPDDLGCYLVHFDMKMKEYAHLLVFISAVTYAEKMKDVDWDGDCNPVEWWNWRVPRPGV